MAKIYQTGKICGEALNLDFDERLNQLELLARSGSKFAMRILIGYFLDNKQVFYGDALGDAPRMRAPEGVFGSLDALKKIADIALEGGHETLTTFLDFWVPKPQMKEFQVLERLFKTVAPSLGEL